MNPWVQCVCWLGGGAGSFCAIWGGPGLWRPCNTGYPSKWCPLGGSMLHLELCRSLNIWFWRTMRTPLTLEVWRCKFSMSKDKTGLMIATWALGNILCKEHPSLPGLFRLLLFSAMEKRQNHHSSCSQCWYFPCWIDWNIGWNFLWDSGCCPFPFCPYPQAKSAISITV